MSKNLLIKYGVVGILILLLGASIVPGIDDKEEKDESEILDLKEFIKENNAVFLYVQDEGDKEYIDGMVSIELSDLECGSCLRNKIGSYEKIFVYSKDQKNISFISYWLLFIQKSKDGVFV